MTTPLAAALLDLYPRDDVAAALTTSSDKRTRNRAIRRVETGAVDPSLETLRRLAAELQCEVLISAAGVDVRRTGGQKLSPTRGVNSVDPVRAPTPNVAIRHRRPG